MVLAATTHYRTDQQKGNMMFEQHGFEVNDNEYRRNNHDGTYFAISDGTKVALPMSNSHSIMICLHGPEDIELCCLEITACGGRSAWEQLAETMPRLFTR